MNTFNCIDTSQPAHESKTSSDGYASAALSLTLPGQILNMSTLIYQKKFRYVGNKQGALRGWELLEAAELGTIIKLKASRGTDKVTSI